MRTTLDLPEELVRAAQSRAAEENRQLDQVVADLLKRGLGQESARPAAIRRHSKLPLIECAHEARPEDEMTPERVASVLLEEEAARYREPLR
jgi:DNA recombination-dependent growth factor C